ncbi:MAG: PKD domain-containing protein [Flavobacteriales bacterium]|jgi:hypothetical protein
MSHFPRDFEESLREAMEHYELPYEPSRWKLVEKRIARKTAFDASRLVAAVAATVVIAAGSAVYYNTFKRETVATQGYAVARMQHFETAEEIHTVRHSLRGGAHELTSADILLYPPVALNDPKSAGGRTETSETASTAGVEASDPGFAGDSANEPSKTGRNNESAILGMTVSVRQSCAGNEIEFDVKNGPDKGSYLWNFGDGNFSNKARPTHRYDKAGTFDVSLSVTDQSGRITTDVMNGIVTINPSPRADFEWDFTETSDAHPTVKIVNTSEHGSRFEWKFGDGSESTAINPVTEITQNGRHMVVLHAENEWGCTDMKVKYIHINNDYNLQAQEQIVAGRQSFMPEALKSGRMNFKLRVFSGDQVVYETSNRNKGWDGHLPGGALAQPGQSFNWIVIIFNESTKEEKFFSGVVKTVNP